MSTRLRRGPARSARQPDGSGSPATTSAVPAPSGERELRARLGLDDRATLGDIVAAHDEVVRFVATAPRSLRSWARLQAAAADEALTLLADPPAPVASAALFGAPALRGREPGGPATPPAHRAITPAAEPVPSPTADFDELLAEVTPSLHREAIGAGRATTRPAVRTTPPAGRRAVRRPGRRVLVPAVLLAGAIAIGWGGFQLGSDGTAAPIASGTDSGAQPTASAGVDEARIAELMETFQANPNDTDVIMRIGDEYYQGGNFTAAATWFDKVLEVDPAQIRAGLALGAARFNLGELDAAKTEWEAVLERDPGNVEAHYDLGFLYLNQEPPDMAAVERSWREVIRLAPDSDIAQTVSAHLDAFADKAGASPGTSSSAAPSGPPDPSGAPAPVASPAATDSGAK